MTERIPFRPVDPDGAGWSMPPSVPAGTRLSLSRAPLLDGAESSFDDWMGMLHERYDECVASLDAERMGFEATFLHQEADGSWWMYHLQVVGETGAELDLSHAIGRDHLEFAMKTKHPGWEELQPRLFLAPADVRDAIMRATLPKRG
ncbi:hypothetical protein EK0264_12110 [Epidermidibacterium keratini]|uniref:Uncharacterized protein n=1 Tax=Epidermidibacterium keratini TaxID=1891644 RepID=A0A7L4YQX6_9ACTN|nr:DUF6176 family protein [Epidermidibacterium keratini]QHC00957.1 hypothetical protein EK0264_12110 [Epidermidibacterium keratini]